MHLCSAKPHFICVMVTRCDDTTQYVAKLGLIIDQLQQGFAPRPLHANAQDIFCGRVQVDDQEAVVEKDDA